MVELKPVLSKIVNFLKERPEVVAIYLYGSQAKGYAKSTSDIDIGVLLDKGFEYDALYIGNLLEDVNNLDSSYEMQTFVINGKSPIFRYKVISPRNILFSKDEAVRSEFEVKTMQEYFEYLPFHKLQYECMLDKVTERLQHAYV